MAGKCKPGAEVPFLSGLVVEGRERKTAERYLYQKVIVKHGKIIILYKCVFVFYYLFLWQTRIAFHKFCFSQRKGKQTCFKLSKKYKGIKATFSVILPD